MKNLKKISFIIALFALIFTSCKKDENTDEEQINQVQSSKIGYVVNYGSYSGIKSEISVYNIDSMTITNNIYMSNNGVEFSSNVQYMSIYNDIAYLMSNNGDKIDIINAKTFVADQNPISSNIVKPRFFVANGNTAYVSCWGEADWDLMEDTYIAKIDLTTKIVSKISCPGGPEGLAIANNKLYAALNYRDSIAVIDLSNDQLSYIETPAVSSYFLVDDLDNLFVTFVSTYSDPSTNSGLGYINTQNDSIENNYLFEGISSNYGSLIQFNTDKSKIYFIASSYDENWNLQGGIQVFNTVSKSYENPLVENISGINGISINPFNDNIFVLIANSYTENGTMSVYNTSGVKVDEKTVGIGPNQVVFYEIK